MPCSGPIEVEAFDAADVSIWMEQDLRKLLTILAEAEQSESLGPHGMSHIAKAKAAARQALDLCKWLVIATETKSEEARD